MNVRKAVEGLKPYEWELSSEEIARRYGIARVLRFDTNTSPYALQSSADAVRSAALSEYPDPSYARLTKALAAYTGARQEQIVVGAGADEMIDVLAKTFIDNGDCAVISAPTYSMFAIATATMGGSAVSVQRNEDFELVADSLLQAAKKHKAKIIFICNPNNPTGNLTEASEIERVAKESGCAVVIDEAYAEFCGKSAIPLIKNCENIVVVRTFSKYFGLAGIRVGYALASESVASFMNRVRPPNSVSAPSLAAAEAALENLAEAKRNAALIIAERKRVEKRLATLCITYPSACNFVLARFDDAGAVWDALVRQGIVTRNVGGACENCLRITIRTKQENDALLDALERCV